MSLITVPGPSNGAGTWRASGVPGASAATDDAVIDRFAVTWRAPDAPDPRRLDTLIQLLLDGPLEDALAEAGIGADEEVCLRQVTVPPHQIRWAQTDADVVRGWSRTIGRAVATAARAPTAADDVVRYPTRAHAVIDIVLRASRGDLSRAWAWVQLGLWPASITSAAPTVDGAAVGELIAGLLLDHPGLIGPALRLIAQQGRLARVVELLGDRRLAALAEGAWRTAGGRPLADDRIVIGERQVLVADDLASRSAIAAALRGHDLGSSRSASIEALTWTWAALVVIEVEPAVAAEGRSGVATVGALVRLLSSPPAVDDRDDTSASPDGQTTNDVAGSAAVGIIDAVEDAMTAAASADNATSADSSSSTLAGEVVPDASDAPTESSPITEPGPTATRAATDLDADVTPTPAPAAPVTTRWGGLLFLLHLIDGADLARRMSADTDTDADADADAGTDSDSDSDSVFELGALGVREVVHGVGANLLARAVPDAAPPEPDDPALLAFAGLTSEELPESWNLYRSSAGFRTSTDTGSSEPVTDPAELVDAAELADASGLVDAAGRAAAKRTPDPSAAARRLIAAEADAVLARLRARLGPSPLAEAPESALLLAVVRRQARIEADPGWIDVVLDLEEVVIDVRRAGLDLDLGYLPWLGVVVRFRYG